MGTIDFPRLIVRAGVAWSLAFFGCAANQASPTPIQSKNCGTVSVIAQDAPTDRSALAVEQCFQAAYRACEAGTTMTLETHGTDVLSKSTFTLSGGSPCGIAGVTETTIVPNRHSTVSFSCNVLSEKNGGLLLTACGRAGDIFIPPPS
jgi:hypothetical protein